MLMGHELSFQLRLTQTTCLLVCQYAAQIAHHPKIKVEIQMVFIDIEPTLNTKIKTSTDRGLLNKPVADVKTSCKNIE